MCEIIEEEYQQFLQDMRDGKPMVFGRYINESEYEDEYTGDWYFEANGKEYCVHVEEDPTMNLDDIDSELEEISY